MVNESGVAVTSKLKRFQHSNLSDSELARLAQSGDSQALRVMVERYQDFVRMKARSYFLVGADREDIFQEGMIGLFKAIRDYRDDKDTSFKAFAELCVNRQMITAIKTATRQKHAPLNTYVSLNEPVTEDGNGERVIMDYLACARTADPADIVISAEEALSLKERFSSVLSRFEGEVLSLYMDGRSYQEIAADLDRHVKSVDNALQRIKRKVEQHLRYREALVRGTVSGKVACAGSMAR